jgi:hypothetical protein
MCLVGATGRIPNRSSSAGRSCQRRRRTSRRRGRTARRRPGTRDRTVGRSSPRANTSASCGSSHPIGVTNRRARLSPRRRLEIEALADLQIEHQGLADAVAIRITPRIATPIAASMPSVSRAALTRRRAPVSRVSLDAHHAPCRAGRGAGLRFPRAGPVERHHQLDHHVGVGAGARDLAQHHRWARTPRTSPISRMPSGGFAPSANRRRTTTPAPSPIRSAATIAHQLPRHPRRTGRRQAAYRGGGGAPGRRSRHRTRLGRPRGTRGSDVAGAAAVHQWRGRTPPAGPGRTGPGTPR